jgi:hypothetical protein
LTDLERVSVDPRRAAREALACCLIAIAYGARLRLFASRFPKIDLDLPYHQAISRITAQQGLIRSLPQVEDLGWGGYFPDKEFLFHLLTTAGHWLGGDGGVELAGHLAALGFLLALHFLLRRVVSIGWSLAILAATTFFVPYFEMRILVARPGALAMLAFVLLLHGLFGRSRALALAGAAMFALAYHAFYVPLVTVLLFAAVSRFARDSAGFRVACFGGVGIALGILLNPYFPSNVALSAEIAQYALRPNAEPGMLQGAEIAALPLERHLFAFLPYLVALGWGILRRIERQERELDGWIAISLALAAASLLSPRASEYWAPVSALLLACCVRGQRWPAALVVMAGISIPSLHGAWDEWRKAPDPRFARYLAEHESALRAIPAAAAGKKVLNCGFGQGGLILYFRPDLRFTYLLDPLLLRAASPARFRALQSIRLGTEPDLFTAAREWFAADYLLCDERSVSRQAAADPRFRELASPSAGVRVFALEPEADRSFVRAFQEEGRLLAIEAAKSPYLSRRKPGCSRFQPAASEVGRLAGAVGILVGGGPRLAVSINGRPWYVNEAPFPAPLVVQRILPLPAPLRAGDTIEVTVCSRPTGESGLSLGFIDAASALRLCGSAAGPSAWRITEKPGSTCQGWAPP